MVPSSLLACITDTKIVEGLELWNAGSEDWSGTVELSEKFHRHLCEHAVPLDRRGIAIHDHIIVGRDGHASLKGLRLI